MSSYVKVKIKPNILKWQKIKTQQAKRSTDIWRMSLLAIVSGLSEILAFPARKTVPFLWLHVPCVLLQKLVMEGLTLSCHPVMETVIQTFGWIHLFFTWLVLFCGRHLILLVLKAHCRVPNVGNSGDGRIALLPAPQAFPDDTLKAVYMCSFMYCVWCS